MFLTSRWLTAWILFLSLCWFPRPKIIAQRSNYRVVFMNITLHPRNGNKIVKKKILKILKRRPRHFRLGHLGSEIFWRVYWFCWLILTFEWAGERIIKERFRCDTYQVNTCLESDVLYYFALAQLFAIGSLGNDCSDDRERVGVKSWIYKILCNQNINKAATVIFLSPEMRSFGRC